MNPFNMGLPNNPIQCPDDLEHYSCHSQRIARRDYDCEPTDDFDLAKHEREGRHLAGYSRKEIKVCQFEVKQRLADQAAHNAEIESDVASMRKFYANTRYS
jgi:hypothetical protein